MKAILLAAGRGTRISKMIDEIPKSTLLIGEKPLIRMTVELFLKKGIEVIVCTGFKSHIIEKSLKGLPVKYYCNPFFDVTNSVASLWMARKEIDDTCIIANADVYFTEDLLDELIKNNQDVVMVSDKSRTKVGDYFFSTKSDGNIIKYGKELPIEERTCEYVGLAKIDKSFLPSFNKRLCELIESQQHNFWWENVLYSFTDKSEKDIHTLDVNGKFWAEVDYLDDYQRILEYHKGSRK